MIVDYFHVPSIAVVPTKADALLIVDPNTILPGAIASEFFQPIVRRN